MEPEANTPPEMIWQIVPVLDYSDPMPPASSDYVSNFCSDDTRYKARSSSMPTINSGSIFDNEEDLRDFFAFNIFPNPTRDRKSTRLNSSHVRISYAVFCLKKKKHNTLYLL